MPMKTSEVLVKTSNGAHGVLRGSFNTECTQQLLQPGGGHNLQLQLPLRGMLSHPATHPPAAAAVRRAPCLCACCGGS